MTREELYADVIKKMSALAFLSKEDMEDSSKYGAGKSAAYYPNRQGIYFLYNSENVIVYVGKIGTGASTSLYHRMSGHGSGAHKKQDWYVNDVCNGKYLNLPNMDDFEIEVIERICIQFNPNTDNYNDKIMTEELLDSIGGKL